VLLGTYWGIYLKTFWEHDKNTKLRTKKKTKNSLPFPLSNRKELDHS
jgi:hypothetical protein